MSGQLIGALILWLIVAIVAIAIIVYLVNWLYRRSSKEVAFVRTGLFGERVVIDRGAFVLPIIHDITPVNMNVLQMEVVRENEDALITKDNLRADVLAQFYIKVQPDEEHILTAARSLGENSVNAETVEGLVSEKLVSALRAIARMPKPVAGSVASLPSGPVL